MHLEQVFKKRKRCSDVPWYDLVMFCLLAGSRPRDCADIYASGQREDGIYSVFPTHYPAGFQVYCDMTTDGGGWTVSLSGVLSPGAPGQQSRVVSGYFWALLYSSELTEWPKGSRWLVMSHSIRHWLVKRARPRISRQVTAVRADTFACTNALQTDVSQVYSSLWQPHAD